MAIARTLWVCAERKDKHIKLVLFVTETATIVEHWINPDNIWFQPSTTDTFLLTELITENNFITFAEPVSIEINGNKLTERFLECSFLCDLFDIG